jgi:hypothetical protein
MKYIILLLMLSACSSNPKTLVGKCFFLTNMPPALLEIDKVVDFREDNVQFVYTFPFDKNFLPGHWYTLKSLNGPIEENVRVFLDGKKEMKCQQ